MSEQEFENWLSLLTGLLQLSPEQRDNISDELRSHLEERMEDLLEAGSSREEAIAAALEDFGDTAALAHHFTNIAHHHRRRRLMRYTYGTIAAMTCSILVLATFWPHADGPAIQNLVAQSEKEEPGDEESGLGADASELPAESKTKDGTSSDPFEGSRERIEAILEKPYQAEYFQVPLSEVLGDLNVNTGVSIQFDPITAGDIDWEDQIFLQTGPDTMSIKTMLKDFILGPRDLVYIIQDNFLMVTTYEQYLERGGEVVVYDCRDLVQPGGRFVGALESGNEFAEVNFQFGSKRVYGAGGESIPQEEDVPRTTKPAPTPDEAQLIEVIRSTIKHPDFEWDDGTAVGSFTSTIEAYKGYLIVQTLPGIHERVEELLELLREKMDK